MNLLERISTEYFLPHIVNDIYRYIGKSKTAEIIEEYWENKNECWECNDCHKVLSNKEIDDYDGICYYCYAEQFDNNCDCSGCGRVTLDWQEFNNTETGLYCGLCFDSLDEDQDE